MLLCCKVYLGCNGTQCISCQSTSWTSAAYHMMAPSGCGIVISRLVPQLKIKIQDPQDPTPLQDFRIQDPLDPTLSQNFRIQDPLDPTQSQNFRIQDPLDPTHKI